MKEYSRERVLIVDDDITLANTIGDQMGLFGFVPYVEHSAEGGLNYWAQDGETKLVVTDLQMPGMDGLELISLLRTQGYKGKTILISGDSDLRDIVEKRVHQENKCRPDAVVAKPFGFVDLQRTLVEISN